ncbi:hypothetical protein BAE44_0002189 [Dichanthelium oligosanthes]|uniref:Uncharacterized protein n=1 Tax=Dichanthelium oligosanthes TaxID=888268 RepID=A0A1E5WHE0_9POAL|nr:hypothetical protein BAE44_0002189 [Dichanthelium oligosanthes]
MGRKRSRSRQPSAPPARRRRRTPVRTGRSRSEPKGTSVTAKIVPAAASRTTTGPPRRQAFRPGPPPSKLNKETRLPWPTGRSRSGPSGPKLGYLAARRTGRLRGQAVRRPSVAPRPGTPPPSGERAAFRASPSPEPAEEEEPAAPTERCRDGGRKRERALYLVMEEQGYGYGHGVISGYAVHRVDLARSPHGISVSGEELEEPPVARFKAAPGMAFFKAGSKKIVGVTDKDAGVVAAESVVIDAGTWEVSTGPPPPSTEYGIVEVSGKIYGADMLAEDPRCEVLRSASDASARWSPMPRPPFRDRILMLAAYPPRRGLLVSTDKGETYLLDRRRRGGSAWVALPGSAPLPFEERAVYAKDHGLWFEVSPIDGRLRAHDLDVVLGAGAPKLERTTHRVPDPIPVITPSPCSATTKNVKLVYLGSGNFCVVQAGADCDGARADGGRAVTLTMFRVIDSEMPVTTLAERRRRRRERGVNAR